MSTLKQVTVRYRNYLGSVEIEKYLAEGNNDEIFRAAEYMYDNHGNICYEISIEKAR